MSKFDFTLRKTNIEKLENEIFDLVIIGGGITGAGVARDACSRGMRVALVEANDFAFGTSSRSSKLIHGGLRYLENLEFQLVFEALSERRILMEIAPHLVHPLKFFVPLYKSSRVGMFKLGLGMWLYDILSQFDAPEVHQSYGASQTLSEVPILNSKDLVGSFSYYDAYMDDDRLVYETLRSANSKGVICANYIKAISAEFINGKVSAVIAKEKFTGKEYKIRGKHFLSTVGPWTDILGQELFDDWKKLLRPTKGIHLTVSKSRLPINDVVVMSDDEKNRIVFVIPRFDMVIVGTTDTDYKGDPGDVVAEYEEVKYLLELLSEYFPGANLGPEDIISSYAGVRPLVQDNSSSEGKTSREHVILSDPRNITFVAGGKYTTYRKMAEQIVDTVVQKFEFEDQVKFLNSNTKEHLNPLITPEKLEECIRKIPQLSLEYGKTKEEMNILIHRHGLEALEIMGKYGSDRSIWELEAFHAIHQTMCMSFTDYMTRRVPLFLSYDDHGRNEIKIISQVFCDCFGLSEKEVQEQISAYSRHTDFHLAWKKKF